MSKYPLIQTLAIIPQGDDGTRATLEVMARVVRAYRLNHKIRELTCSLFSLVPEKDALGEIGAIQEWVRDNIRYTADIFDVETVQDPLHLLHYRHGDCDDKTILAATMLQTVGYPVTLQAVAFDGGAFSHVLCLAFDGAQWVSVETTEPVSVGWYPDNVTNTMDVYV